MSKKVRDIAASAWGIVEVRFDFSSVNVVVLLETERRIPLVDLLKEPAA